MSGKHNRHLPDSRIPSFQYRLAQSHVPAVNTQLSGVEPSGRQHQRELVGSTAALWVFPRCRYHFLMQTVILSLVVEGGEMNAHLLENLSNILSIRWTHTTSHYSF
jgi:hypothetical protein